MPPDQAVARREWEIPHLLGDARDLRRLDGADRARVASELEHDAKCFDALHLVLLTLDPELPEDLRMDAAAEFEELFGENPRFAEFVENVLFSNPLPKDGDLPGALHAARDTGQPLSLLTAFERHQNQIAEAWIAWQGIPDELFIHSEDRQQALSAAVRSGGFRRLAGLLYQGKSVDLLLAEAFADSAVQAVPKHREIWAQWVRPLREESRYPVPHGEVLEVAESRRPVEEMDGPSS
jgi:hypothetical protein